MLAFERDAFVPKWTVAVLDVCPFSSHEPDGLCHWQCATRDNERYHCNRDRGIIYLFICFLLNTN